MHFDCAGSQNQLGASGCSSQLRSRRGAVRIFGLGGHFCAGAKKTRVLLVLSRRFVAGAVLLPCADLVGGAALWTRSLISWQVQ